MKKVLNKSQNCVSDVFCGDSHSSVENVSQLLTLNEAATLLNLKISRIRNLIFLKRIPYIKIGASIRFSKSAILDWIQSNSHNVL